MSEHKHDWLTQMFVFPEADVEGYEHDEPYEVLYCSDRNCGQRTTKSLSEDLAAEVRKFNAFPDDEVRGGE